jgi:hypothetical protein
MRNSKLRLIKLIKVTLKSDKNHGSFFNRVTDPGHLFEYLCQPVFKTLPESAGNWE